MRRSAVAKLRLVALVLALALGPACSGPPRPIQFESKGDGPDTADGLYRVRTQRVGAAFLKPGASFANYDSMVIDPVTVSYKRDAAGEAIARPAQETFEVNQETTDRIKRIFQESFERVLSRSKVYSVAPEPGPRTLRVSGHIVNLVIHMPRFRSNEANFVLDAGEMTLVLGVRDSETNEPLARVADRRLIRPTSTSVVGGFESNAVNNWGAVREIVTEWARFLREGLDDLHTLTAPPAPE